MKTVVSLLVSIFVVAACQEEAPPPRPVAPIADVSPAPAPAPADPPPEASELDFEAPLTFDLGRGSGLRGLELIHVDPTGAVEAHRRREVERGNVIHHYWERATLTLDAASLGRLRGLMATHRLGALDALYDGDMHDGVQWLMRIQQGEHDRVVYCDNRFPPELRAFATDLDALLAGAGLDAAPWERVPRPRSGEHDNALWEALYASRR